MMKTFTLKFLLNCFDVYLILSIKSDEKGAPECDIFHQLFRRYKNGRFGVLFVSV